jgi:hypothetical protein
LQLPVLALAAGIWVLGVAEILQSWEMYRLASSYEVPARIGDLVSATLVNGQVFFGTLDTASRTTIRLRDVFFAQLPPQTAGAQQPEAEPRAPIILRRKDNEWTQADVMAIPVDRIAFMETVGIDSRIARLIADSRSKPVALPTDEPANQSSGFLPATPQSSAPKAPAPNAPSPPPKG